MSKNVQTQEPSWEEAVSKYLEEHPDYFQRHLDLLATMSLPHAESGGALSLIERQVRVLRDKQALAQQQLRDLLAVARENDVLGERLHHFACAMIDAGSLEDALDTARETLRQEFRIDVVVIRLRTREPFPEWRAEFVPHDNQRFQLLMDEFAGKKAVCGGRYDIDLLRYVFAEQAQDMRSCAFVPLKDTRRDGVLCLGSRDAQRFHPDLGTVYLVRVGELLMRCLARY